MTAAVDDTLSMVEETVFHLFESIAADTTVPPAAVGDRLTELGWAEIEVEYPAEADRLLYRAQGRFLTQTDCLDRAMLAELTPLAGHRITAMVLPTTGDGYDPGLDSRAFSGLLTGPVEGVVAVPISGSSGSVEIGLVDVGTLQTRPLDTFDRSLHWLQVHGAVDTTVPATAQWRRAVSAAHRGIATELVALADEMLGIAVDHGVARVQFGRPIGSYQSPRHALAEATAVLEGTRALLDEAWRRRDEFSSTLARTSAGRAHRTVCDVALQVCGAIGLTAEHRLHRYVVRGFQLDSLLGSYRHHEATLARDLFGENCPGTGLPTIVSWDRPR
ncbi:acyl-CoA/acyl-ACP dehydrogenase [Mycobacterium sp. CVI_P3]|uniref:Acyl-CoA/acyl-ACP dehydrogenase n=1 Tax=Mycobacterium pinniadriaticum TaxID=2994102 RepID=A0ABT3SEK6_9MYCO|nr:acyl-CoA dehydrogenase family protein [Mycobacterium pinniadriaticum]MCX2931658.1 acyl-CoA/acyl-ACP dehydrogenase [Mycobacterium pinniadriaticum]MCX2937950.1 acyl-CoA/acyl-ACP dehydrogenase [Mycobacterium pinniadriaticum]